MPGTTAGGTSYALPEDPLVQWPATSQGVATRIDSINTSMLTRTNMQLIRIGISTADESGYVYVTQLNFKPGTWAIPIGYGFGEPRLVYVQNIGDHTQLTVGVANPDGAPAPGAQIVLFVVGERPA